MRLALREGSDFRLSFDIVGSDERIYHIHFVPGSYKTVISGNSATYSLGSEYEVAEEGGWQIIYRNWQDAFNIAFGARGIDPQYVHTVGVRGQVTLGEISFFDPVHLEGTPMPIGRYRDYDSIPLSASSWSVYDGAGNIENIFSEGVGLTLELDSFRGLDFGIQYPSVAFAHGIQEFRPYASMGVQNVEMLSVYFEVTGKDGENYILNYYPQDLRYTPREEFTEQGIDVDMLRENGVIEADSFDEEYMVWRVDDRQDLLDVLSESGIAESADIARLWGDSRVRIQEIDGITYMFMPFPEQFENITTQEWQWINFPLADDMAILGVEYDYTSKILIRGDASITRLHFSDDYAGQDNVLPDAATPFSDDDFTGFSLPYYGWQEFDGNGRVFVTLDETSESRVLNLVSGENYAVRYALREEGLVQDPEYLSFQVKDPWDDFSFYVEIKDSAGESYYLQYVLEGPFPTYATGLLRDRVSDEPYRYENGGIQYLRIPLEAAYAGNGWLEVQRNIEADIRSLGIDSCSVESVVVRGTAALRNIRFVEEAGEGPVPAIPVVDDVEGTETPPSDSSGDYYLPESASFSGLSAQEAFDLPARLIKTPYMILPESALYTQEIIISHPLPSTGLGNIPGQTLEGSVYYILDSDGRIQLTPQGQDYGMLNNPIIDEVRQEAVYRLHTGIERPGIYNIVLEIEGEFYQSLPFIVTSEAFDEFAAGGIAAYHHRDICRYGFNRSVRFLDNTDMPGYVVEDMPCIILHEGNTQSSVQYSNNTINMWEFFLNNPEVFHVQGRYGLEDTVTDLFTPWLRMMQVREGPTRGMTRRDEGTASRTNSVTGYYYDVDEVRVIGGGSVNDYSTRATSSFVGAMLTS
ncbi:MAG: hypothetical protein GF375_01415, partial [Candidatus Omnitrophica bacterium]|nr:hypothetical protein [Candidatus Omnitrophota bacterium]